MMRGSWLTDIFSGAIDYGCDGSDDHQQRGSDEHVGGFEPERVGIVGTIDLHRSG